MTKNKESSLDIKHRQEWIHGELHPQDVLTKENARAVKVTVRACCVSISDIYIAQPVLFGRSVTTLLGT